jgi:hypothetical protein
VSRLLSLLLFVLQTIPTVAQGPRGNAGQTQGAPAQGARGQGGRGAAPAGQNPNTWIRRIRASEMTPPRPPAAVSGWFCNLHEFLTKCYKFVE